MARIRAIPEPIPVDELVDSVEMPLATTEYVIFLMVDGCGVGPKFTWSQASVEAIWLTTGVND